ncbi:DUF4258 domain-containing protein [Hymenobacter jeollabukensis]|uniref:DUF4258 domain-containing protein n=1 Tax=Hymenobacter jeollabukensis TaxID=2025313 RepID=A0A5R8WJ99_9BACT|nr:DUF4258 domain-containing protein [Hymenobacter jeollabukensis]TLM88874.1 DUF4258 domain-containing protein [Hymenobacter jeollabukensis]
MKPTLTPRPAPDPLLNFRFEVSDPKTERSEVLEFNHTRHSAVRAAQRGIDTDKIALVLQYGECLCKQKLLYYILGEKNIPASLLKVGKELKNLVVIVAGDSNQVVTCYRSNNPFKHIRLKSKRLSLGLAA